MDDHKLIFADKHVKQIMPDIYNLTLLGLTKEQVMEMIDKEWDKYDKYVKAEE